MIKTELNKRSPLRILEKSIHGGLEAGQIGVITARKGVGKTACLVHIATDCLFQGKYVIHVSFSSNTEHIISWYEDIFNEIAGKYNLDDAMDVHDEIIASRIIMNFNQKGVRLTQVARSIKSMINDGNFSADCLIIDGYNLAASKKEELAELKTLAREAGLEIWFSSTLKDNELNYDNRGVPVVLAGITDEIDVLICLKPNEDYIHLQLVKDHSVFPDADLHLRLDPESLLIQENK